jgi:hypothetical protein
MKHLLAVEIGKTPLNSGTLESQYPNVNSLVNILLKNSFTVASVILIFLLIYGGITFIMSAGSGDQKKADQSKNTITSALIGFIVVICAYFIVQIIQTITGVDILK